MKEIKLIVVEARTHDVGRGIARIDKISMKQIGVEAGKYLEIIGKKRTVVIAWPNYEEDENKGIIRLDRLARGNAGLSIGEQALVRSAKIKNAEKIILAPVDMRLRVDADFTKFVKVRLMERAFLEQDITLVILADHAIRFQVVRTSPHDAPVVLTESSAFSILNEPVPRPELKLKTPSDIRYLLRFDWLDNLTARIKAKKIVFSIPDHEITSEKEQEVINSASKIAYKDMTTIRVEVTLKSNGTIIGTLPWVEVDLYGRVSAIYPDIPLPPLAPSFVPQMTYDKVIPPMKRCFKTGVKHCPKEINFSPKSIVVAMPFEDEFKDTYKYAIRPTLEEADFKPWKADEQISNIDMMCKICQAVQESGFLLANITTWNANVVFELGLAYGLARNVILIKHKRAEVPVDLKGLEYIEYSTIDELKKNLSLFLKGVSASSE